MTTSTVPSGPCLSRRNVEFLLFDWLRVEELCDRPAYRDHGRDIFEEVLDLAERISRDLFAPHNALADVQEPHVRDGRVVLVDQVADALRAFTEAGLMGMSLPDAAGGMRLPHVVADAALSFFHAANAATTAYAMLTTAAANLLVAHGSQAQVARWVTPMIDGRALGTMCLSEPQAGSSLADVATRAERQTDGTYRLFGTKMWISGGEHELTENIVHLVLARTPQAPAGVKGLSLFVVPRFLCDADGAPSEPNDVVLAGLNHKMGYRGTVNTVLGFGEGAHRPRGAPGAVGELIGAENAGLASMFHMMNEARIAVGTAAACLGSVAYLKSVDYARDRPQGRPIAAKDPSAPQVPIVEHSDVRRMLLAQKAYVEGALALVLYCSKLLDDERTLASESGRSRARALLDLLTPIAKSWPSRWCLEANSLAIQVHGGYGYARDYGVEQHYRDNRLNPIHEGTHGIQALDLLGRKVTMDGGAALAELQARIADTVQRAGAAGDAPGMLGQALHAAATHLDETTRILSEEPDRRLALANASIYLDAAGDIVVAWLWLDQLIACGDAPDAFAAGKRQAARYFFAYELPRVHHQLDLLAALDRTTLDTDPAWL